MRIVFMGTPDIAATILKQLLESPDDEVIAVVSQPDKPQGRGYTYVPTPVKQVALSYNVPVLQPEKIRTEEFEHTLKDLNPDLILVVAYGKILPKFVLDTPRFGCINVHVSLLPRWRGAAPMQRAIMAGDTITGITFMQMDEGLDTGDILVQESFEISKTDTFETIHDKSAEAGARLIGSVLRGVEKGTLKPQKQPDEGVTYAAKIEKEECEIQFDTPAERLDCILRGLTPIPLPYTYLPNGKMLKVCAAHPSDGTGEPGSILELNTKGEGALVVACKTGALAITRVRPEGKGTMAAADFLRGAHLVPGEKLGR